LIWKTEATLPNPAATSWPPVPMEPTDLFYQLPCPSMVTDMAGRVLICNAVLLELLGSTQEALIKTDMAELFAPADQQLLRTRIWPSLMRQEPVAEKYLQLRVPLHDPVPVLVNARKCDHMDPPCYQWVFFVARERCMVEAELVTANEDSRRIAGKLADQFELLKVTITSTLAGARMFLMPARYDAFLRAGDRRIETAAPAVSRARGLAFAVARSTGSPEVVNFSGTGRITPANPAPRMRSSARLRDM
jgi:PAS domain S-box-containing protein